MATIPNTKKDLGDVDWGARLDKLVVGPILKPLASLKLTVWLFVFSIILIVAGTLAQTEKDIWLVIDQYFRCWFAKIELKVFFPEAFFPNVFAEKRPTIERHFWFPGGWLIGGAMAVNLLSAHLVRFKAQAKGARLAAGTVVIFAGCLLTTLVILSGSNKEGFQDGAMFTYAQIWYMLMGALGLSALGCFYVCLTTDSGQSAEKWMLGGLGVAMLVVLGWLLTQSGGDPLADSSMRILWQLMKATFAGIVLYIGCYLVFRKRAGIVLLHGGIGLMMLSELLVGTMAVESKMTLVEGETRNYVYDIREYEISVVDSSNPEEDDVIAIPQWMFDKPKEELPVTISHPALPFDIEVTEFMLNSDIDERGSETSDNPVDAGIGLQLEAKSMKPVSGIGEEFNIPALFATFKDKDSGQKIGTHLLSLLLGDSDVLMNQPSHSERIMGNRKPYDVTLRFRRAYKPYEITLQDVRKDDYVGTSTPSNYSSDVHLVDSTRNVDRDVRIWMNNPLRFAGETFYQSGYNKLPGGSESTTLAVVTNTGWMIPYVSCMIVIVGMMGQFLMTLTRFLSRRQSKAARQLAAEKPHDDFDKPDDFDESDDFDATDDFKTTEEVQTILRKMDSGPSFRIDTPTIVALVLTLLCMAWIGSKARPPKPTAEGMNLYEFGQIPVAFGGRVKPIDTLARNSLRMISDREEVTETYQSDSGKNKTRKRPATEWLLDVIANPEVGEEHKVFRIENLELLTTLGLERRKGFRYSLKEVMQNGEALITQARRAHEKQEEGTRLDIFDQKVLELESHIGVLRMLQTAFISPDFEPNLPHEALVDILRRVQALEGRKLALSVPTKPKEGAVSWHPYYTAGTRDAIERFAESAGVTSMPALGEKIVDATNKGAALSTTKSFLKFLSEQADEESTSVSQLAAVSSLRLGNNPFLQKILQIIADAPEGQTAEQMVADLNEDELSEIQGLRVQQSFTDMLQGVPANMRPSGSTADERRKFVDRMTSAAIGEIMGEDGVTSETNPAAVTLQSVLTTYKTGDADAFNNAVAAHKDTVSEIAPEGLDPGAVKFESFFNNMAPFYYPLWIYLFAGVLSMFALLGWSVPLNRTAFFLILATLVVHTCALIARIYISGRPPVTNLYSSAVFIGWAMVLLGLLMEVVFKMGLGNLVAATAGSSTLAIAHQLAGDGDTFTVLQAVLDTQFWLATHVVCITCGYAATFVAGLLALCYVLGGVCTPVFSSKEDRKTLSGMIYGTLCLAILLSFFGTVLGGLWADDSWGRFWGWDPKENGALVIVIWNAVVLHARWGGMVKERGMATLAIAGNIWTACSWFGVNELGVGLHAYGFREGMLRYLGIFIISQLVVIAIGLLPKKLWLSHTE